MKIVDPNKLREIIRSIGAEGQCSDGKCEHCVLQKVLTSMPGYKETFLPGIFMNGMMADFTDVYYPLHLAVMHGFLMAWEYRSMLELEQLAALDDTRSDTSDFKS